MDHPVPTPIATHLPADTHAHLVALALKQGEPLERHSSNRERAWQGCRDGVG